MLWLSRRKKTARLGGADYYWRTLRANFELNPKYPGGLDAHQALLEAEGHRVITKGKRRFLANATDLREPKLTLKAKKPLQIDEVAP